MRPAWRLAISSLSARKLRSGLLACSVALSAALIAAIACAMASVNKSLLTRFEETTGKADALLVHAVSNETFPEAAFEAVRRLPDLRVAVPRGKGTPGFINPRTGKEATATFIGIDPELDGNIRLTALASGRELAARPNLAAGVTGEVVLEEKLAERVQAVLGDVLEINDGFGAGRLVVVGILRQPALAAVYDQFNAYVTLPSLWQATRLPGRLTSVDVLLGPGVDAQEWVALHGPGLSERFEGVRLMPSAKVAAGLQQNLRNQEIGFILGSTLAFFAAAFIITTGLTTNLAERSREMAIVRCIGGTKGQLALSQLFVGGIVGLTGGLAGLPLGVGGAAVLVGMFREQLPAGFAFSWLGVTLSLSGALLAGLIGGVWPAVSASRVSPLEGLGARGRRVKPFWMRFCLWVGLAGIATQALIVITHPGADITFWAYVTLGIPALLGGYFLLAVPVTRAVALVLGPVLARGLRLPGGLLERTVAATPYRHGFTAGAMMLGLAMMVSIWTNGRSTLSDWLNRLDIPDAFAYFPLGTGDDSLARIARVDGVRAAVPISLTTVELDPDRAQGVVGIQKFKTSYIGFEPDSFFRLTNVQWENPTDPAAIDRAKAALADSRSLLVASEFAVTHGMGPGQKLKVTLEGRSAEFTIVGVVRSPGLDIVSKFYSVGQSYSEQSVNAIFGSRQNLITAFGAVRGTPAAIKLVAIDLDDAVVAGTAPRGEGMVMADIRRAARGALEVGSKNDILSRITGVISTALLVASVVAVGAMVISCFSVANLVVAGIHARQFEFGVLRAAGAQRWLLGRLIIGEALIIALGACIIGTAMGTQGAWGGQRLNEIMVGIQMRVSPPLGPIAVGWAAVVVITLLASWPAAAGLVRRRPRELLGAMKG